MFRNETFVRLRAGIDCPLCPRTDPSCDQNEGGSRERDHDRDVVATLESGKVRLQNDANYRGYCILILDHHATEIHELSEAERRGWIEDIARIERVITSVCNPAKINIAMLGNLVPHLHCHVIPRYFEDTEWGAPPLFRTPAERRPLDEADYSELLRSLRESLL